MHPTRPAMPPADWKPELWQPQWSAPLPARVQAAMSTRHGGVSSGPWGSLNLGAGCGDDPAAVAVNRRRLADAIGARPVWLQQVHGCAVQRLGCDAADADLPPADASWTDTPGMACAVLVADCLPVLMAARDGRVVAAAHAGWRGLAAGVLQATVQALRDGGGVAAADLLVWLGPCIGPQVFEVGVDVLAAFGATPQTAEPDIFRFRPRPDGAARWLADLPALAAGRLQAAGVPAAAIHSAATCTVSSGSDLFSFRRDGVTGRQAAVIWLAP